MPQQRRGVFHDPSGRRSRAVRAAALAVVLLTTVVGGSFVWGLLQPTIVEPLPLQTASASSEVPVIPAATPPATTWPTWWATGCTPDDCPRLPGAHRMAAPPTDPIVAAFMVQWDAGSRGALRRFGDRIDWAIVEGGFLGRGAPGELTLTLDPDLRDDATSRDVRVHLMLTNYAAGAFDPALVRALLATPERTQAAREAVRTFAEANALAGITVDFERLAPDQHAAVLAFMRALRADLAPLGATVGVALPLADEDPYPLADYARAADYVIPMLYDEHASSTEPGPVASAPWFARKLAASIDTVRAAAPDVQLLAGLGQYGYHWRSDRTEGVTVSVNEAAALSRGAQNGSIFDGTHRNPGAMWRDAAGVEHRVWFLDATTAFNQTRLALGHGAQGVAFWRLGGEDPTLWRALSRTGLAPDLTALDTLPDEGVTVLEGDGEVLAVHGTRGTGLRNVALDSDGFIASVRVAKSPGGWVVSRGGHAPRAVALTFDDGPDPQYTAMILDTLRAYKAPASFFVVGKQVQKLPWLAQRIVNEGHEIANHTYGHPDLATMPDATIRSELAAANQVIEAVTGRRPRLFRPPYLGDARPATEERLRPMAVADGLGLRVVALEVDSRDWQLKKPHEIVQRSLRALDAGRGRIVLLHDAGGDRTPTVAAVGPLIDSLRARGYTLTTVAGLLDAAPDAGAPAAPSAEAPQRALHFAGLVVLETAQRLLAGAFLAALVLGLARFAVIGGLALWQQRNRQWARRAEDAEFSPRVTVLVPAYNEARVIGRTVTSLLAQDLATLDVLVIDDGSTDDTADAARRASDDPRVRVITQKNGGKASALNTGLGEATGDVIVVVDADTQFAPDAIRKLVRPLADTRVAAVAGNAKVGNRVNAVTRWQAVEYVTSQNLDRRAFEVLNAVTVVPGAIGAWHRGAVIAAGGFRHDTLAEDQDLTLTLLRDGHRIAYADDAIAYTEAPETFGALLKQRYRWSFGTLQCAWKHRDALLRRSAGSLGLVGLPNVWLFQLLFPLLAPAADVMLLVTLTQLALAVPVLGVHAAWAKALPVVALYALFLAVDTAMALLGLMLERGEQRRQVLLVPLQRFGYRQVLYLALVRAMWAALRGWSPGWGKLERTGRVAAQDIVHAATAGATGPATVVDGSPTR